MLALLYERNWRQLWDDVGVAAVSQLQVSRRVPRTHVDAVPLVGEMHALNSPLGPGNMRWVLRGMKLVPSSRYLMWLLLAI